MKKLFSIFAALLLTGSLMAQTMQIRLIPGVWDQAGAKFAAATLNEVSEKDGMEALVNAQFSDWFTKEADGSYVGNIPADTKEIAFGRFNPEATIPAEAMVATMINPQANLLWNHSDILTLDPSLIYKITGWEEQGKNYCPGTWVSNQTVVDGYYLMGDLINEWTPSEEYLFVKNEDRQDVEEFMLTTRLIEGDEIKVVYVENGVAKAYYPAEGANFIVPKNRAGLVTIYFQKTYNNDWVEYGGHMWIVKKAEPIDPSTLPRVGLGAEFNNWNWEENLFVPSEFGEYGIYTAALQAGTYEFKIVSEGKWLTKFGENGLFRVWREWPRADHVDQDVENNNLEFVADIDGEYTFYWYYADSSLVVFYPMKSVPDGYYLVGTFNNWTPKDEYLLRINENAEGDVEEFMVRTTLSAGDELKVVFSRDGNLEWYPNEGGNYVVPAEQAGPVVIYFRADWNDAWNGYFYIASAQGFEQIRAAGKATKVMSNGQLLIIKGNKTFNALGAEVE